MVTTHSLGFPRIGKHRELKKAVEHYWQGELTSAQLLTVGENLRKQHLSLQAEAGIDLLAVGDFSFYDHVLDTSAMLNVVPERFGKVRDLMDLDTYFRMGRGRAPTGQDTTACEMTKWFDTNYHYIVPEFTNIQHFELKSNKLFEETKQALEQGHTVKPVLLGPLTYLWLGKALHAGCNKLQLLNKLIPIYCEILKRLTNLGVQWVQIDEPILTGDLPQEWLNAFAPTYTQLGKLQNILLATYFGSLGAHLKTVCALPVAGLHIDAMRGRQDVNQILQLWPTNKVLSAGMIDGRNIWRADLQQALSYLKPMMDRFPKLWISTSCSLLHCPVDLSSETKIDPEIKQWLAFSTQKIKEVALLKKALQFGETSILTELEESNRAAYARAHSLRIHKKEVKQRVASISASMARRLSPFPIRQEIQHNQLQLPLFPTTTIGSFPQTSAIRKVRSDRKLGFITEDAYLEQIRGQIAYAVQEQENLGLDVFVHGEAERNDMVEYFGEMLDGFVFTQNGWVQSYGSRCVKPPIIYGDVSRPKPMTVDWIRYAQSLTQKPMKGMLTGPVTILCWSFVRDDQPRMETARQIALALRDEVQDLENAGIPIIQIDEPAFREGLPLKHAEWAAYLKEAAQCFRLTASCVRDETQIHTHMCYCEFNDVIDAIADLDADVITLETSRSNMELLKAFETFAYPNEIGPGVYDIHSPRIPSQEEMEHLIDKAAQFIPPRRLWVNPDCGLKTRNWPEVEQALSNMVKAAKTLRSKYDLVKVSV